MAVPTLHVKVQPASDVNTEYIVFSSGIDQGIYIDHAEPSQDEASLEDAFPGSTIGARSDEPLAPFVRRLCPQTLSSWTRLLDGGLHNPGLPACAW